MTEDDDPQTAWWYHLDELIRSYYEEFDMPKVSDMIESKFLRKEDFDEDRVLTIKGLANETMQGGSSETRWVLYFSELPKGMVLNTTTIRVLEAGFGDDSDDWIGKKVQVYVDPNVSFQGRIVGGLRLRTPKAQKPSASKLAPPAQEFSDDIPF